MVPRNCPVAGNPERSSYRNCEIRMLFLRRNSSRPATFIGISTTQMKHLERRGIRSKGTDRPQYVPPSLVVRAPELNVSGHNL